MAAGRLGRIFCRRNFSRFRSECESFDWGVVFRDVDSLGAFHTTLTNIVNSNFPVRRIKPKHKDRKRWITRGIRISAANLRCLNGLRLASGNAFIQRYYFTYRKIYRSIIGKAKQMYYTKRFSGASNKQKESWAIVNEITGRTGCDGLAGPEGNINANLLNHYFCSIADTLTRDLHCDTDPLSYLEHVNVSGIIDSFQPTSPYEIRKTIRTMKNKTASTDDGISLRVLEGLPHNAILTLSDVINMSFLTASFPSSFKEAKILPLHKGGDRSSLSNYRPISLLPTLSKLIKCLIKSRVVSFLERNTVLADCQFGFLSGRNTLDAMLELLSGAFRSINERETFAAVFCDLSKAFDCVSHEILLRKLYTYGIRGDALRWLESYLTGRLQSVFLGGVSSGRQVVPCGVPQGSVLGPILFLLYINDLAALDIAGSFAMFADDTTIFWHNGSADRLAGDIERDMARVKGWCAANRLSLNMSKTHLMGFGHPHRVNNRLLANNCSTPIVEDSKFLGLTVDANLKFHHHVADLCRRLASGCFSVRATFLELGLEMARSVYFALVESHLRYALPFWGACPLYLFNAVFVLQKRAVRNLCGARPRAPCRDIFVKYGLLTLPSLFVLETACLVHKNKNKFPPPLRTHASRREYNIPLPIPHSSLVRDSLIYKGIRIYNHIDDNLKSMIDMREFRRVLGGVLLEKALYRVDEFFLNV